MRIDGTSQGSVTEGVQAPEALRQSIQVANLKRALDGQKQEAADLLKLLEPKGRVIDIRV